MSGWHICEAAPWLREPIIRDARGWAVATAVQPNNTGAAGIDAAANARLIAAAPDLLEIAERLLGFAYAHGDMTALRAAGGMLDGARAVIDRAKGEE